MSKQANFEDCRFFRIEIQFFGAHPILTCHVDIVRGQSSRNIVFSEISEQKQVHPPIFFSKGCFKTSLRTPPFAAADSMASAAAEALPETAVDTATRWQLCARQSEVCICEARGVKDLLGIAKHNDVFFKFFSRCCFLLQSDS